MSRISDLLTQRGQGRWHHTWHLTPSPSFVFPLHHFPSSSSSLQEMKLSLWVLPSPSLITTHRRLGLRKWKLCSRLLISFPSPTPSLGSLCCCSWLPPPLGGVMQNLWAWQAPLACGGSGWTGGIHGVVYRAKILQSQT